MVALVADQNDEWPYFEQPFYSASVMEDTPIGTTIMTVTAKDKDQIGEFHKRKRCLVILKLTLF